MIVRKASLYFLVAIFLISFSVKVMPLYKGHNVPFGAVDTSSHISTALDVREGNFKSLIHPWWHIKNHVLMDGYDIVDRNAASFFYPPFISMILAFGFLFLHPGTASIIAISFLYSLSVIAVFLLCKSFGFKDASSLVSGALIAFSPQLLYSQNYGFWTFSIALNFIILSYVFLRLNSRKSTWIGITFCFLAVITHWAFFPAALAIGLLELIVHKSKEAKLYILSAVLVTLPLYAYVFYLANPLSYVGTHFEGLIIPSYMLVILAISGFFLNFRKHPDMSILALAALTMSFVYYILNVKFIFGDMVQFAYPFFTSFYASSLFQYANKKSFKIALTALVLIALAMNLLVIQQIFNSMLPSIATKEFDQLLQLRKDFKPDDKTILAIDRGLLPWWLTIVSKDSKIVYPDSYESEDISKYYKNYINEEVSTTDGYVFYRISKQNNFLTLEKNATLSKKLYGFEN